MREQATTVQLKRQPAHQAASRYGKADGAPIFSAGGNVEGRAAYPAIDGVGAVAKGNARPVAPAPAPAPAPHHA